MQRKNKPILRKPLTTLKKRRNFNSPFGLSDNLSPPPSKPYSFRSKLSPLASRVVRQQEAFLTSSQKLSRSRCSSISPTGKDFEKGFQLYYKLFSKEPFSYKSSSIETPPNQNIKFNLGALKSNKKSSVGVRSLVVNTALKNINFESARSPVTPKSSSNTNFSSRTKETTKSDIERLLENTIHSKKHRLL